MKSLLAKQSSNIEGNSVINPITKEISQAKVTPNKVDDKLAKSIVDKTGDGLNSNVIKLSDHIKKLNKSFNDSVKAITKMSAGQVGDVTANALGKRQFNTLKPRVEGFKANVKDFFTMRGFLDKTGIAKRGSGGLVSEYLDRGEAKKKYVDQRMKTKGTTFGSKETFEKQFDEQQRLQSDISKNEKEIQGLYDNGATEAGLKRGGYLKKREDLATAYAKVTPDARLEGFDPKTGKMKVSKDDTTSDDTKDNVIPFKKTSASAAGGEEAMLEQNKMVSEQTSLLIQIEENTRGLSGGGGDKPTPPPTPNSGGGGMGLMDMLGMGGVGKKVLGGVKAAGSFLGKGASFLGKGALTAAKFIGKNPLLMAGTAVAAGAYTGYKGYQAAGDKQDAENAQTDADLAAGNITKEQADTQKLKTGETATVGKSKSVGKGSGMAVGGAAGALKGAALGAALGSVVPVVGTAIGALLGGAVGGIGGSYLGGKAGDYLGEKAGQVSNVFSGAKNSVLGMFGMGDKVVDNGDGSKTTFKSDGTKTYDKIGAAGGATGGAPGASPGVDPELEKAKESKEAKILQQLAREGKHTFSGKGKTVDVFNKETGELVHSIKAPGLISAKELIEVAGVGGGTASANKVGAAGGATGEVKGKVGAGPEMPADAATRANQRQDNVNKRTDELLAKAPANLKDDIDYQNTKRQQAELEVDKGRTVSGVIFPGDPGYKPTKTPMTPVAEASASKEPILVKKAGGSMIAGEPWSPGTELSKKQLIAIDSGIRSGNNYSFRVMEQYDKQKGNARAAVTTGAPSGIDGDSISKKSTANEQAKMDAAKPARGGNTAVVAPTINNTSNQTQLIKSPIRNQESSQSKYLDSRYAF